ncbi:hypothetical protein B0T20DRAFT_401407 [Sordaria brevicollis]|uniref:Uncharacterized protein n=1 Tax=Sordaria brevicollis TaxID=83679 RepID=A0AAE0PK33_SORBR|nr:hypothetical protein B0T20DRAFT_401407 [Sordaria brevicollis]
MSQLPRPLASSSQPPVARITQLDVSPDIHQFYRRVEDTMASIPGWDQWRRKRHWHYAVVRASHLFYTKKFESVTGDLLHLLALMEICAKLPDKKGDALYQEAERMIPIMIARTTSPISTEYEIYRQSREAEKQIRDEAVRLREENAAFKAKISDLKSQIGTLRDENMALTHEVGNLKAEKGALETAEVKLKGEVDALASKLSDAEAAVRVPLVVQSDEAKRLLEQATNATSKLSEVTEKLDQANEGIKELKIRYERAQDFAAVLEEIKASLKPAEVPPPLPPTPAMLAPSTSDSATEQARKRPREDSPDGPEGRGRPDSTVAVLEQVVADLREMNIWYHNVTLPLPTLMGHLSVVWSDHQARARWQEFLHSGDDEYHCFYRVIRSGHGESSRCKDNNIKCSSQVDQENPCIHVGVTKWDDRLKTCFYLAT